MIDEPERRTILFDQDGTLIDQFKALHRSFVHVMEHLGLEPVAYETIRGSVGGALHLSMEKFVGKENVVEAIKLFEDFFEEIFLEDLHVLPGSRWILEQLHNKGYNLGIFTNKPGRYARMLCDKLGIGHLIQEVIGVRDTPYSKPDKEFTEHALERMGSCPKTTILIGDSHYDIDAGACVGMPVYMVTTGSHTREQLANHSNKPHGIFDDLYEVGENLFGLEVPKSKELVLS